MSFLPGLLIILCVVCLLYLLLWGFVQVRRLIVSGANLVRHLRSDRFSDHRRYLNSENMIPLSLLVPVGDAPGVAGAVRRFLELDYPEFEVIVIHQGGGEILQELTGELGLLPVPRPIRRQVETGEVRAVYRSPVFPHLIVLDKAPGDNADALNAGINLSRYPHLVTLHPSITPERDALLRLVMPFITDPAVMAAATNPRVDFGAGCRNLLSILRTGELMRGVVTSGASDGKSGCLMVGPGAVGAFQKRAVIDAGGFSPGGPGETNEMILHLHKHMSDRGEAHRVHYVPEPLFRLALPASGPLWRRLCLWWQRTLVCGLRGHRDMLLRPKYGDTGLWWLPSCWLFEGWGLFILLAGYILVPVSCGLGFIDLGLLIGFFALSVLFGVVNSLGALLMETNLSKEDPADAHLALRCLVAILSNFGYRQSISILKMVAFLTPGRKRTHGQR